jgi:hypothetical protein
MVPGDASFGPFGEDFPPEFDAADLIGAILGYLTELRARIAAMERVGEQHGRWPPEAVETVYHSLLTSPADSQALQSEVRDRLAWHLRRAQRKNQELREEPS